MGFILYPNFFFFFFFLTRGVMREKLLKSINRRMVNELHRQNPVHCIREISPVSYVDTLVTIVYLYSRPKKGSYSAPFLTEMICAIGHAMMTKWSMPVNSSLAAKIGAFFLYSFDELGILEVVLGQGKNGHATYIVRIIREETLQDLWKSVPPSKIEKLPSIHPHAPWKSSKHSTGLKMVKTQNTHVLDQLTPETHNILFECLNKAQRIGWKINKDIYELQDWALKTKSEAFQDIWGAHSKEARSTKLREAKAISSMADKFLNEIFYHLYYFDFRGRKYAATAYLHEQGSDVSKGLLLRADSKPIGEAGFNWLLISIASNWGGECGRDDKAKSDKIPLHDRAAWVLANEETFLNYGEFPKEYTGWMKADKPWQFIAACTELSKLRLWQLQMSRHEHATGDPYQNFEYSSHLEAYIDGTNNGSQHLAALTKDELTAPHVNLTPSEYPGDLYSFVADRVWSEIAQEVCDLPEDVKDSINEWIDAVLDIKSRIVASEKDSEQRADYVSLLKGLRLDLSELDAYKSPMFWLRVTDKKHQRKIVKRNVMTLPYGGTPYGMGQQQIDDARKHKIPLLNHLEHKWAAYMGRVVYKECRVCLKRPSELLKLFEKAGKDAEQSGLFLNWRVPITGFPVVQNYTHGKVKKIYVQYGPKKTDELTPSGKPDNSLQLAVCFIEDTVPSKGKQAQGAAPNCIHSLDAGHLAITVYICDFGVTTVHDSYGSLLADMPELFMNVRTAFVSLYKEEPLQSLFNDIGADISEIEMGTFKIDSILESQYCFS